MYESLYYNSVLVCIVIASLRRIDDRLRPNLRGDGDLASRCLQPNAEKIFKRLLNSNNRSL